MRYTDTELWNDERNVCDIEGTPEVPRWINADITPATCIAIEKGGCESGAYMPAVTYYDAKLTMGDYGDDVMDFIEDAYGEIPALKNGEVTSWSGISVFYLSCAVELWAGNVLDTMRGDTA